MPELDYKKIETFVDEGNKEYEGIKQDIVDTFVKEKGHHLLKNPQTAEKELKKINDLAENFLALAEMGIQKSLECFLKAATPDESQGLGCVLGKLESRVLHRIGVIEKPNPLQTEDFELLKNIAKRVLSEGNPKESSLMWSFIISLNPIDSEAWVGWAISETENGHKDIAKDIYLTGLKLLPKNAYLAIFAAEFFVIEKQKNEAIRILKETIDQLNPSEEGKNIENLKQLLSGL